MAFLVDPGKNKARAEVLRGETSEISIMFGLRQRHLLPDADWHELQWVIQNFGRRKAIRESWGMFRDGFEAPFHDFLDAQFSIADNKQ